MLNPQTGNIAMFPWKDVAFAIGALLLTAYTVRIYYSGGVLYPPIVMNKGLLCYGCVEFETAFRKS